MEISSRGAGWSEEASLPFGWSCVGCKRLPCLLWIFCRNDLFGMKSAVKCESGARRCQLWTAWNAELTLRELWKVFS